MTYEEAAAILDPDTRIAALAEIGYYSGFNSDKAQYDAVNDACRLAAEVLRNLSEPPEKGGMSMANFDLIEYQKRVIADLSAENKALKDRIDTLNNQRIKIQYHGEELTIQEICERLERTENRLKFMSPCDLCGYNPPSSGDGKPCSFCPASKKED